MLGEAGQGLLKAATDRLGLTARAYHRLLKVARTVADLAGADAIEPAHLADAAVPMEHPKDNCRVETPIHGVGNKVWSAGNDKLSGTRHQARTAKFGVHQYFRSQPDGPVDSERRVGSPFSQVTEYVAEIGLSPISPEDSHPRLVPESTPPSQPSLRREVSG